jgi:hypothetical protein
MNMSNRQRLLKLARRLERWAKQLRAYERKHRPKRGKRDVPVPGNT